jgi:hypothetical protein
MSKDNTKNLGEYAVNGGPGRPKGGRRVALDLLDNMLADAGNQEIFKSAIQREFEAKPLEFFRTYVMPLMPKNIEVTGEEGGAINTSVRIIIEKDAD